MAGVMEFMLLLWRVAMESLLRLPEVMARTGLSRPSVYQRIKRGTFPSQISLGRACAWVESEIDAWVTDKITRSRSPEGLAHQAAMSVKGEHRGTASAAAIKARSQAA